jgi:hypothetical protein
MGLYRLARPGSGKEFLIFLSFFTDYSSLFSSAGMEVHGFQFFTQERLFDITPAKAEIFS